MGSRVGRFCRTNSKRFELRFEKTNPLHLLSEQFCETNPRGGAILKERTQIAQQANFENVIDLQTAPVSAIGYGEVSGFGAHC